MKRSEFGKIVRLAKQYLNEEKMWGEAEILLEDARKKDKDRYAKAGPASPASSLEEFRREISGCKKCPLGESRLNLVFGTGDAHARLMFVGEGPGFDEDHSGEPFIGNAGQLLTKIIEAIGFTRQDVYIANIVKCHPMLDPSNPEKRGNDRPPSPEEMQACLPYLEKQVDLIQPKLICALGNSATQALLAVPGGISKLRGRFFEYRGIPLMPTYHPAALLRNPSLKKDVWADMKMIRARLAGQ
ncbi:MAG: uracil-DNA glycosylase [Endomicrobiales bacterium]